MNEWILKAPAKDMDLQLTCLQSEAQVDEPERGPECGSLAAGFSVSYCMFLTRQRCFLLLKLFSVRCGWARGGGGMCEKREGTEEGGKRGGDRMMGQVWNLHTLLVANTIDIFTSAWWVTLLMVEERENVGFWGRGRHKPTTVEYKGDGKFWVQQV